MTTVQKLAIEEVTIKSSIHSAIRAGPWTDITLRLRAQAFVPVKNALGEGPHYESSTGILRWVDIIRKQIHTVNINEGPASHKVLQLDVPVG